MAPRNAPDAHRSSTSLHAANSARGVEPSYELQRTGRDSGRVHTHISINSLHWQAST